VRFDVTDFCLSGILGIGTLSEVKNSLSVAAGKAEYN
jgi:hypothetical protein